MKKIALLIMMVTLIITPLRAAVANDMNTNGTPSGNSSPANSSHCASLDTSASAGILTQGLPATLLAPSDNSTLSCCDLPDACSTSCLIDCATGSLTTTLSTPVSLEFHSAHSQVLLNTRHQVITRELVPPRRPPASFTV